MPGTPEASAYAMPTGTSIVVMTRPATRSSRSQEAWYSRRTVRPGSQRTSSEPPPPNPPPPQAGHDVRGLAHDVPDQPGAVVFDHQNHRALVDAKVERCDPSTSRAVRHFVRPVERWLEAVLVRHAKMEPSHGTDGRHDDLRRERERGNDRPRRDGAVVGAVWHSAGVVVEEFTVDAVHGPLHPAGTIGRRDSPAEFTVAGKFEGIVDRILPMDVRRHTAVLKVVASPLAPEGVGKIPEVDPERREVVREERPGVEHFAPVDRFPLIC